MSYDENESNNTRPFSHWIGAELQEAPDEPVLGSERQSSGPEQEHVCIKWNNDGFCDGCGLLPCDGNPAPELIPKKQYRVRRADRAAIELVEGRIIYLSGYDAYGLKNEDTRNFGIEYEAFSVNPSGKPVFTMPLEDVELIVPPSSPPSPAATDYLSQSCTESECKLCRLPLYARKDGMQHSGLTVAPQEQGPPERIWMAKHLIANDELAKSFNVPPDLRSQCVEYAHLEPIQRALEKCEASWGRHSFASSWKELCDVVNK